MRCFSRAMSDVRDARRFRRRTNKQHQQSAYTNSWQARKASVHSLPARYRQGARQAGRGRGQAGARQGRGRGHQPRPSLITRRE